MNDAEWTSEPDLNELQRLHALLLVHPKEAAKGLEALAGRGSMMSSWYLAESYTGTYLAKDIVQAKYWYKRAAELGSPESAFALGQICEEEQEYVAAFEAISRSAELGYLPALYRLAIMHIKGIGTEVSVARARKLLMDASERGHLFAKRDLARLYLSGAFGIKYMFIGVVILLSGVMDLFGLFIKAARHGPSVDDRLRG